MSLTRNLRLGAVGEDVLKVKELLLALGMYSNHVTQLTTNVFGMDTRRAVRKFQMQNDLAVDGVVGQQTYHALLLASRETGLAGQTGADAAVGAEVAGDSGDKGILVPEHIGIAAAGAISQALEADSDLRREMARDALQYAYDPAVPGEYPLSLYIRGGNLYNSDLVPNVITLARIASGAKRQPQYYDGGRREMMERAVGDNPSITGADCSGGVVGLLRHAGVVKPGFDLSADGFFNNRARYQRIAKNALRPGDLVHKQGHIGMYVGGGYAVEWAGGAYGCQLTKLGDRRVYDFVTRKTNRMGQWTGFLRPTYY